MPKQCSRQSRPYSALCCACIGEQNTPRYVLSAMSVVRARQRIRFHNWRQHSTTFQRNATLRMKHSERSALSLSRSHAARRSRCQDDWKAHTACAAFRRVSGRTGFSSISFSVLVGFSKRRRGRAVRSPQSRREREREALTNNFGNADGASQLPFAQRDRQTESE